MTLLEALPKDNEGHILLQPGGKLGDGTELDGQVEPSWLQTHYPKLATAEVPLSEENFNALRAIDWAWERNADRWREEEII